MTQFEFDYNIGDVIKFRFSNAEETIGGEMRGRVDCILISQDTYGYMVNTVCGDRLVRPEDVIAPIYSTKSFDVYHPGLIVHYQRFADDHLTCTVEDAFLDQGRLYYKVRDTQGTIFIAPEGKVSVVNCAENAENFR